MLPRWLNPPLLAAAGLAALSSATLRAQEPRESAAPAAAELTALVKDFLAGASRNDAAVHDRFWADDLIYTRAAGQRLGNSNTMGEVFLVLLKKGPAWTAERTDRTKAIQEAHMANIKAMLEGKKLIIAGPMGDDGDMRGVFVFQAGTLAEAKALAESDPAVQAGRLVAEIHPWWVEKRALPEAGAYCRPAGP